MKATLLPGLTHRLAYQAPENKTVPFLYPGAADLRDMPKVFAPRFIVELMPGDRFDALGDRQGQGPQKEI